MKNIFISISILLTILSGCTTDEKENPVSSLSGMGKIQLVIDTENAPADVVTVEALLTRDGFDPIIGTLNIISDSTADILLDEIAAGVWHIKVDAKDGEGVVLYTGETDVEVFAGFVTNVNLVLNPTGEGKGSIYIYVTWGMSSNYWNDFNGNPILLPSGSYYETYGVGQANVIYVNGIYKMWYLGDAGGSNKYVMYAESINGIDWNRPVSEPVLSPGPPGSWDDLAVHPGAVIYEDGMYYMFYVGWSDPWGRWDIGFAESVDGITWNKHPQPVLTGTSGWEYQIGSSSVIKIGNTYYLYYYMRDLPYLRIGLATSTDRINWQRYSGNPILTFDKPWENTGVYYPTVYKENNQYKMIFMNVIGSGFGMAYSSDGMNWTKDESNPFFTKEQTANNWANEKIAYPYFINMNNKERIYYTGFSNTSVYKIGFVEK